MMIYFHCSDLHVTPRQRDRNTRSNCCFLLLVGLGLVKTCFCFYPSLFLIQCNEIEIICSMLKMMMLVSKERKSTRFFHSISITKQRRAWTEVDIVIGKAESRPLMSTMLSKSKKNSNGIWGQTGEKASDVGSNRIYCYFPKC